jgi:hypothetical protein
MKPQPFIIGVLALPVACCHGGKPQALDRRAVSACMARYPGHDAYELAVRCEPLAPEQTFQGVWTVGFEESQFMEESSNAPGYVPHEAYLVVPRTVKLHRTDADPERSYRVVFAGRRFLLPYLPGTGGIVLDKLISIEAVPKPR